MSSASGPGMLSLRRATHDAHQRTDFDLGRGDWLSSPSAYAAFLDRTLRFHRIVETAVAPVALRIDGLEYPERTHSRSLEGDLAALAHVGVFPGPGADEPSARAPALTIDEPGAALGCLYVVEGATLGATVLAQWIEARLGYDRDLGASSFAAHQGATMIRWRAFGALVEARLASVPNDLALMLAFAQRTFALHRAVVVQASRTAEAMPT